MALTEERIAKLEAKGFKRWTKGSYDRLYINASALGLDCAYYKTGNISGATFGDHSISNSEARRMKAAKTYIDVKTGEVHSDNYTLEQAVKAIVEAIDEEEAQEAAEAAEQKTALEEAKEILEGKITDENRELAEEVERIRKEGKESDEFSWAALLAGATKKAEAAETVTEQETAENKEGENTMKKRFGDTKTKLELTPKAQRAYDETDPLNIYELSDGTYEITGAIESSEPLTAAEVNELLEETYDEFLKEEE